MKRVAQCVLALAMGSTSIATAATLNPSSYDMPNGWTDGGGGRIDNSYNGSGDKTTSGAPLSGGLGDLTDGIIPPTGFLVTESPYVGWDTLSPLITFHFSGPLTVDRIIFYVDDVNNFGVAPPASIDVRMNGGAFTNFAVTDPPGVAPFAIELAGLGLIGNLADNLLDTRLNRGAQWVFASEIQFQGVAAIPEPSTYALMLAGLGFVGWATRRRMRDNA